MSIVPPWLQNPPSSVDLDRPLLPHTLSLGSLLHPPDPLAVAPFTPLGFAQGGIKEAGAVLLAAGPLTYELATVGPGKGAFPLRTNSSGEANNITTKRYLNESCVAYTDFITG